ncbi:TonB-dependent siderophore receptor [Acetobacteraceae bacterium H6797]|nr:TonB-dependent siderophore receptor [Acetobacteraceae bacterium H6797]
MTSKTEGGLSRPLLSGAGMALGVAAGFGAFIDEAQAQTAPPAGAAPGTSSGDNAAVLPEIGVTGAPISSNVNEVRPGIARLPDTIRETPQTVNVVPQELIQQQRITTLEDALRNVPGITMSTGEGNGGLNGDQFRIRGLQAKGDIYLNGLRDFGAYVRDTFNTENIEVYKGPTGQAFGSGNVGGVINQQLKAARLGNFLSLDQSIGTGMLYRTTVDGNYQINETTALRLNAMWHQQDVADRDHIYNDRWGVAADLGMGLGTDLTWHLNYQFLHINRMPDYGVPMMTGRNGILRPATEFGLDRSTSYARSFNHDRADTSNVTSSLSWKLNDFVTLTNDTRFTYYERDFTTTTPGSCNITCTTNFLNGVSQTVPYGAGGGLGYKQEGWGLQNISNARLEFLTGAFRHRANVGVDISYQRDFREGGTYINRVNNQDLENPQYNYSDVYLTYPISGHRVATATDLGLYASDRMWFTEQLSVAGALRWDRFDATHNQFSTGLGEQEQEAYRLSPSASLIFEPNRSTTLYASFARSYKPVGTDIASQTPGEAPVSANDLRPERSDLLELGGKADFFGGRLGLSGAIFQIRKSNSYTYNQDGEIVTGAQDSGEGRRIRGAELGITGKITPNWDIYASYAYLTGRVTATSPANAAFLGNSAPNVPKNNLSLWTSYDVTSLIPGGLEGKLVIGGGMKYSSAYWLNTAHTARAPSYLSYDAMISYEFDKYRVSLNGYNLTDRTNYSSAYAGRAVPTSGRTVLLNVGVTF